MMEEEHGQFSLQLLLIGNKASDTAGHSFENKVNLRLLYLLTQNNNYYYGHSVYNNGDVDGLDAYATYTDRQRAVYKYFNTWAAEAETAGFNIVNDFNNSTQKNKNQSISTTTGATNLLNQSINYADNNANCAASIKITKEPSTMDSEGRVGPFQIEYTGTLNGITITCTDSSQIINNNNIKYYYKDSSGNFVQYNSYSNIVSGKDFWISTKDAGKTLKQVKFGTTAKTAQVTFYLLSKGNSQPILYVDSKTNEQTSTAYATTNVINLETYLEIKKVDKDNINIPLSGVKFYLIHNGQYAKSVSGNVVTSWTTSLSDAYKFTTDSNGKISVTLPCDGISSYSLKEIEAAVCYTKDEISIYSYSNLTSVSASNEYVYFNANGGIASLTLKNKKKRVTLNIKKTDVYGNNLSGVKFTLSKNGTAVKTATTNSNGIATMTEVEIGDYVLTETTPAGFYSKINSATKNGTSLTVNNNKITLSITDADIAPAGEITININITNTPNKMYIIKKDETTGASLANIGFKIQDVSNSSKYLVATKNSSGVYTITGSTGNKEEATEFLTGSDGRIEIRRIENLHKYTIIETKHPDNYDGYISNATVNGSKVSLADTATSITVSFGSDSTITISLNNRKLIDIFGYVWIDIPNTKANTFNSLDDRFENDKYVESIEGVNVESIGDYRGSKEKGMQNVIVYLRRKDGKEGINGKGLVAETKTDKNGKYSFNEVISKVEANDYYIEFDYSELDEGKDKQYIPVAFNSTKKNGSRALQDAVAEKDTDLIGEATTYSGIDTNKEQNYGLSGILMKNFFNSSTNTLEYINLGIKEIPDTNYEIDENIAEVNVTMKGYTYKYVYGGSGDKSLINAPKVNWQGKGNIAAYTRAMYPSDIAYDSKNGTTELKVDVTYRIDVTNTEKTNIEELYQEKSLTVTELTNEFDTDRYTLADNNWSTIEEITDETGKVVKAKAKYNALTGSTFENISNEDGKNYAITYITFSINHNALLEILGHPDGIVEDFPTKVTATAYHNYTRDDYSWANNIKGEQSHKTAEKEKSDDAPYLILKLGETRKVKGTVFEDSIDTTNPDTENGAVLGNGQYENKEHGDEDEENVVSNVKVDLLDVDGKTISTLYKVDDKGSTKTEPATTYTKKDENDGESNDGSFVLEGMVPGEYYLRFTYADGSQRVYTPTGEEVTEKEDLSRYKSTIVASDVTKNVLQAKEGTIDDKKWTWYKYLEDTNYSVAVDNLTQRAAYNDDLQKEATERTTKSVYADTARMSITIESTKEDSIKIEVTDNGQSVGQNEEFVGFNFGIIRTPKQDATIEKVISNVRLINSQNNVIFDGNPTNGNLTGVSDLSEKSSEIGGSTFTRVEINENELYGATLTITYTIRITNISETNYYGEQYYWFGNKEGADEVTLRIDEISDSLDNKLVFNESNRTSLVTTDKNGNQLLSLTEVGELYTNKNKTARENDKKDTYTDVIVTAKRTLSSEDDDMEFINTIAFKKLTNGGHSEQDDTHPTPEPEQYRIIPQPELPAESPPATVTVTPPTGEDKQSGVIYITIGIVALVVLSTGIVIIKKKVL